MPLRFAVVIAIGKGHDSGGTSTVYCLNLSLDNFRLKGNPIRLLDINGKYLWNNDRLRAEDIHVKSIVIFSKLCTYVENTGKIMVSAGFISYKLQFIITL